MSKSIILIIVSIVIAVTIVTLFGFQGLASSRPQIGKCGDGVCEAHEKINPDLCLSDCKEQIVTQSILSKSAALITPSTSVNKDSPFGIFAVFAPEYSKFMISMRFDNEGYWKWAGNHFRELGAKWSRGGDKLIWGLIEPELGKGYDWNSSDKVLKAAYQNGGNDFNMVGVISPSRRDGSRSRDSMMERPKQKGDRRQNIRMRDKRSRPGSSDIDESEENYFKNLVKSAVERYDGDGIGDYDSKIKVKYWQADNEPFPRQWKGKGGTIDGYIRFLELMSEAVREADSQAKIVLGSQVLVPNPRTGEYDLTDFQTVISKIKNKRLFDIIDLHYWGTTKNYKIPKLTEIKSILNLNGYGDAKIFLLEHGTYVNQPKGFGKQSEVDQAVYLIKSYVYNLANSISLINWNNLVEWDAFGKNKASVFNFMGLISDGENGDNLNILRLSYYTYKKMVEVLDGCDWNNIQKIQEKDGIYIYRFLKNSKPIWVAWDDSISNRKITISNISSKQVKTIKSVPMYNSGSDVKSYNTAFDTEMKLVNDGQIVVTLAEVPVFIYGE